MSKNSELLNVGGTFIWFYRGTNLLAQVPGDGAYFQISESLYHDESGALHAAWEIVYNQQ